MEKTIMIDEKPVRFKMNAAFTYVFKRQFGKDILTMVMPLVSELLSSADEVFKKDAKDLKPSDIAGLLEDVYSLEIVDIQNIIWTMAKLADDEIQEPALWYSQFEEFAIFDVASELATVFFGSLVSKKKLENLRKIVKKK